MKKILILSVFVITIFLVSCVSFVDYNGTSAEKEEQAIPYGFTQQSYDLSKRILSIYEKFNNAEISENEADEKLEAFANQFEKMNENDYDYSIYSKAKFFLSDNAVESEQEIKTILSGKEYNGITNIAFDNISYFIIGLEYQIDPKESKMLEYHKLIKKDIAAQEDKHKNDKTYYTKDGKIDLEKKAEKYISNLYNNNFKNIDETTKMLKKICNQANGFLFNGFTNEGYENAEAAKEILTSNLSSDDYDESILLDDYIQALQSDISSQEESFNQYSLEYETKDAEIDKEKEALNILSGDNITKDSLLRLENLLNEAKAE